MAFEPQSAVRLITVPFQPEETVAAADVANYGLLAVPTGANFRIEMLRIGVFCEVLAVPDGGSILVDIEFRDSLLSGPALVTAANLFSLTNYTEDRTFDANTAVEAEVGNVLATFVSDLQNGPPYPEYNISNLTIDRTIDQNSSSDGELADGLGTLIQDIIGGSVPYWTWSQTDVLRTHNHSTAPTNLEFADLLYTLQTDLSPRVDLTLIADDLGAITIQQYNPIWAGSQILEGGDAINAELATHTASTVGLGYSFIVEYRVLQHS